MIEMRKPLLPESGGGYVDTMLCHYCGCEYSMPVDISNILPCPDCRREPPPNCRAVYNGIMGFAYVSSFMRWDEHVANVRDELARRRAAV